MGKKGNTKGKQQNGKETQYKRKIIEWERKAIQKENNRMGKTRDRFKKNRDTKGTLHAKMNTKKDRNGIDLTEAEDVARIHRRTIQKRF